MAARPQASPDGADRRLVLKAAASLGLVAAASAAGYWVLRRPAVPVAVTDEICVVVAATPHDPTSGLSIDAPRPILPDARCPVCGMYPARSRDWAAQVIYGNGDAFFFDSPLSLFAYMRQVARYTAGRQADDIVAIYVTDAASGNWIDARQAIYVQGSSALGPMRAGNFPAFATRESAEQFVQRRGGQLVSWEGVDSTLIDRLLVGRHHRHDD